ncbi:anthranilate phosphoribosyltransferase [bacterium]|nr:anthranilate phosphoribosyltransferase [bacterium]
MIQEATRALLSGRSLERSEARGAMEAIFAPAAPVQVASFLTALTMKGETPDEIAGLAEAMRAHAVPVPGSWPELLDTCGTGGDRSGTFNISTTVAFIAASCGLKVAKHGNRSASSLCGSADVLEALGVHVDLEPEHAAECLEQHGITFLFAPRYHPAMKHVAPLRRELGFPTAFNLLGPLCNPLRPSHQVLGVFRHAHVPLMARTLRELGTRRALVVHGHGGLDELSLEGPSEVAELKPDGTIRTFQLDPRDAGLQAAPLAALAGGDAPTNARLIRGVLSGEDRGPCRDVVLWNAAAALWIGGAAHDMIAGVALAAEAIDSGAASAKLEAFGRATRRS